MRGSASVMTAVLPPPSDVVGLADYEAYFSQCMQQAFQGETIVTGWLHAAILVVIV